MPGTMRQCTPFSAGNRTAIARHSPAAGARSSATSRREVVLQSSALVTLAALFNIGRVDRPSGVPPRPAWLLGETCCMHMPLQRTISYPKLGLLCLGVQDYGQFKTLALCPKTSNCVSTAEEANDDTHFVPTWTYNPEDGRGRRNPASKDQAMSELVAVIKNTKPDNFTPEIVKQTKDYLYVEYTSPTFGFVDDTEFYFPDDGKASVEYRSASRIGESDNDINRKRIRALRKELQQKGWRSNR